MENVLQDVFLGFIKILKSRLVLNVQKIVFDVIPLNFVVNVIQVVFCIKDSV